MNYRLITVFLISWSSFATFAQDQIFLKNGDGILDCYIIGVSDSVITFRTLDQADKNEYEIPNSETYGFLLEDPSKMNYFFFILQKEGSL